jgi:hypothetical protein
MITLSSVLQSCSCSILEGGRRKGEKDENEHEDDRGEERSPSLQFFDRARARARSLKVAGEKGEKDENEHEHEHEYDRQEEEGITL